MSWEDPQTVDGFRALVFPAVEPALRGQAIAIKLDGDFYTLGLDDARGFVQRLTFAIELAQRERFSTLESRVESLEWLREEGSR